MVGNVRAESEMDGGIRHVPDPERDAEGTERPGRRRSLPVRRVVAVTVALAGVAFLAAACSSPSPATGKSLSNVAAKALAYSRCMRSHGIKDYPDPTVKGNSISLKVGGKGSSDLNPSSPAFKSASRACRSLQPGGPPGPASAQDLAADVRFAACMRSHGFPAWPDPDSHGVFNLPSTINTNSAQYQSAVKTCQARTKVHGLSISQRAPGSRPGGGS